jgi:hypothetical protein
MSKKPPSEIKPPAELPSKGHPRDVKLPSEKNETEEDLNKLGQSGDRNKLAKLG